MKNLFKKALRIAAMAIVMVIAFENVCFAGDGAAMSAFESYAETQNVSENADESFLSEQIQEAEDSELMEETESGNEDPVQDTSEGAEDAAGTSGPEGVAETSDPDEDAAETSEPDEDEVTDGQITDDTGEVDTGSDNDADGEITEETDGEIPEATDSEIPEATVSETAVYTYDDRDNHCQIVIEYSAEIFGLDILPEIEVRKVCEELPEIISAVEKENEGMTAGQTLAYDITFRDENGNEVEPVNGNTVKITFKNADLKEDEDTEIKAYHVDDDIKIEEMELTAEGEDLALDASSFTIYLLTALNSSDVGTGRGIVQVSLLDFKSTGHVTEEETQNIEIYNAASPSESPEIIWEPVNPALYYPLEISADFVKENVDDDRSVVIELAPGLRFNYKDPEKEILDMDQAFESVTWDITTDDHGYDTETARINKEIMDTYSTDEGKPYQPRGGRITIKLKHTAQENYYTRTFSIMLVAEKALINYKQCSAGYELEDAIKVSVSQGKEELGKADVAQAVIFRADEKDYQHEAEYEKGYTGGNLKKNWGTVLVTPGQEYYLVQYLLPTNYAMTESAKAEGFVMKKLSMTIKVDSEDMTFTAGNGFTETASRSQTEDGKVWRYHTFTRTNFGNAASEHNYCLIKLFCVIPGDAEENTEYKIWTVESEQQWWNEDESETYHYEDIYQMEYERSTTLKVAVNQSEIGFYGTYYGIKVAHGAYFQKGIISQTESGARNYQTQIGGTNITKRGSSSAVTPLIYEAELPADKMFVYAVGIPFSARAVENADDKEAAVDKYYPGKIIFTDTEGNDYTIERKAGESAEDYKERIDALAVVQQGKYDHGVSGFIVSTETLADTMGYDKSISLQSVKVWLPDYANSYNAPYDMQYKTSDTAYSGTYAAAGVYGYPLEGVEEGDTYTITYTLESGEAAPRFKKKTKEQTFEIHFYGKEGDQYKGNNGCYSARPSVVLRDADGKNISTVSAGDEVYFRISNWGIPRFSSDEDKTWKPLMWIPVPKGMVLNADDAEFTYQTGGTEISVTPIFTDVTDKAKNKKDGWRYYELTFNEEVPYVGGFDSEWYVSVLSGSFSMYALPTIQNFEYSLKDLMFSGSELRDANKRNSSAGDFAYEYLEGTYSGTGYGYGLSNNTQIGTVNSSASFTAAANPDIVVESEFKKSGDSKYTKYDGTSDGISLKNGDDLDIRVSVGNITEKTADELTVYVPIPKAKMKDIMGTKFSKFFSKSDFDMFLKGTSYDGAEADALFELTYAEITKEDEVLDNGMIEPDGGWKAAISDDVNFIKISLKPGKVLAPSVYEDITFSFKITEDASKVDTKNKWRSSYGFKTEDGTSAASFINKTDNFGCVLQIGEVRGTVYLDANRNGKKDDGEDGISGVLVKAVDSAANTYTATTSETGTYQITGLPGEISVNVTVYNPGSTVASASLPRKFTKYTESTAEVCGSDVKPNTAGTSASKNVENLKAAGGNAVINAGLIEPLTHSFLIGAGDTATVEPAKIRSWPGQKIEEATQLLSTKLPVVTPASSEDKHNGWKIGDTNYTNDELLAASFTEDQSVYAVICKSRKVTVEPKASITYTGKAVTSARSTEAGADTNIVYTYVGDGTPSCAYYVDSKGRTKTTKNNSGAAGTGKAPVWAGTYYVKVNVAATPEYGIGESELTKFTIGKAELTAAYVSETITYGDPPALAVNVSGFVNGETAATAKDYTAPTVSAEGKTDVERSPYTLTPSGGSAKNYSFSYKSGELTITAKPLAKPSANAITYRYTGTEQAYDAVGYDGNTMDVTGNTGTDAKDYSAVYSLKSKTNYSWADGTTEDVTIGWTINKATLRAIYGGETIVYGDTPVLAVTVTGFVNGETPATAAGYTAPTVSAEGKTDVERSPYTLTPSGGSAKNYSFSYKSGKLTITAKLVARPSENAVTYTYTGVEQTYDAVGYDSNTMNVTGNTGTNANSYSAVYSLKSKTNYSWADGTTEDVIIGWTINKASLKAIYGGETIVYGGTPALAVTVVGFVNGETPATAKGYKAPTISAEGRTDVDIYPLTPAGGSADNYDFTYKSGNLIITKAEGQITAPDERILTYNGTDQALISGVTSATGTVKYSTSETGTYSETIPTGRNAGEYTVWYYSEGDTNHEDTDKKCVTVKILRAGLAKPSAISSVYTYSGYDQELDVTGYDSMTMDRSGYKAKLVSDAYTAEYSLKDTANYTWTDGTTDDVTISWSIVKACLVAAYQGESIYVGGTPKLKVVVTGFVADETAETAAGYTAPTVSAAGCTAAGTYTLTPEGGSADNYYFTYVSGYLKILSSGGGGGSGSGGSGIGSGVSDWNPYIKPVAAPQFSSGKWKLVPPTTNVWTFVGNKNQKPVNVWLYLNNPGTKDGRTKGYYYFDENGYMVTGWAKAKEDWYYLNPDKTLGDEGMMNTGWHYDKADGHTYYLDKVLGRMLVGKQLIDGKEYVFSNVSTKAKIWIPVGSRLNTSSAAWVCADPKDSVPYGAMISGPN